MFGPRVLVVGPKSGSREAATAGLSMEELADGLGGVPGLAGSVVLDDRPGSTLPSAVSGYGC